MTILRFSLDTSCVLNLLNAEEALDADLVKLLRLAMLGHAQLVVTETCPKEVAAAPEGRRSEVAKRAAFLPVAELPDAKRPERDRLAAEFFNLLWPNSQGTSKMSDHSRRDCEHLASHVLGDATAFVTRDGKLRDKVRRAKPHARLVVLSPEEALGQAEAAQPKPLTFATASFAVRRATSAERDALSQLLTPLRANYPDFEGWLSKTLGDQAAVVNLGVVNGKDLQGVAIWKPKDSRTAKLSTFYLRPQARSLGLGQHLLFHCLRQWIEKRVERAYVTASSEHEDIISFCLGFGFRIEGAAQRRYASGSSELVLTKHLVYRSIPDGEMLPWAAEVGSRLFSIHPAIESAAPKNWLIPPRSTKREGVWNESSRTLEVQSADGDCPMRLSVREIEELLYPVRVALKEREAYVIPIQPQWAERMMEMPRRQEALFKAADKLMLRIDNAYYCAPVYADDTVDGAPIVFYVSQPESALTGVARILSRVIAEPEDLFLRFGQLGIYQLENIKKHVAKRGRNKGSAMAMHFGWWVPFPTQIDLSKAKRLGFLKGHPQRTLRVTYECFEAMMREGGLDW